MDGTKLRPAWTSLLLPHPWEVFLSLTFSRQHRLQPDVCQRPADRCFRRLVQFVNENLYGKRWLRTTPHKGVVWARVDEAHRNRMLHFHACLYSPSAPIPQSLIRAIKDFWERNFGFARSEAPHSRSAVIEYMTKHVGNPELAELYLSHNFPKRE